jgi:diguanylate cyclase (GGDEF)-like protein
VNDTYGHAAGDAVIAHVARILVLHVRDSDIVGRLGGDEFGVILAYPDEAGAREKAESLAQAVSAEPVDWNGVTIPASVSWGVHTFRSGDNAGQALDAAAQAIEAADRAMYAQKKVRPGSP